MKGKAYFETNSWLYEVLFDSGEIKDCNRISKSNGEKASLSKPDVKTLLDLATARQVQKAAFMKKLLSIEHGK